MEELATEGTTLAHPAAGFCWNHFLLLRSCICGNTEGCCGLLALVSMANTTAAWGRQAALSVSGS